MANKCLWQIKRIWLNPTLKRTRWKQFPIEENQRIQMNAYEPLQLFLQLSLNNTPLKWNTSQCVCAHLTLPLPFPARGSITYSSESSQHVCRWSTWISKLQRAPSALGDLESPSLSFLFCCTAHDLPVPPPLQITLSFSTWTCLNLDPNSLRLF